MPPVLIDIRRTEDARDVVHRAVQALVEGKLVAFPTETVYGVAASALVQDAVGRLLRVKHRPAEQPLTLAVKSAEDALDYVPDMCPMAWRLARRCWPGPVTLVLENHHPDSLLSRLPQLVRQAVMPRDTVGLRVPAHDLILNVMRMLAGPLALSSANRKGRPDAVTGQEVVESLGDDVQLVLEDGKSRYARPSSVVRVDQKGLHVLRAGVVPEDTLKRLSGFMLLLVCTGNTCRSPMAEIMARQMLAARLGCKMDEVEDAGIVLKSAGVAASAGGRPSVEAIDAMARRGLDLGRHETQPLSETLVRHADTIFTMTGSHRRAVVERWPEAAGRTSVLAEDEQDIVDPIGGTPDLYQRCADQIKSALESRLADLDF